MLYTFYVPRYFNSLKIDRYISSYNFSIPSYFKLSISFTIMFIIFSVNNISGRINQLGILKYNGFLVVNNSF